MDKVVWHLNCAIDLNPHFIEAIDLKEKITGKQVTDVDNSTIRGFVRRMIMEDNPPPPTAGGAALPPSILAPPPPKLAQAATQPTTAPTAAVTAAPAPSTQPAPQSAQATIVAPVISADGPASRAPTTRPASDAKSIADIPIDEDDDHDVPVGK